MLLLQVLNCVFKICLYDILSVLGEKLLPGSLVPMTEIELFP